jgi:hypothetical protein
MSEQTFTLQPFSPTDAPNITIATTIARQPDHRLYLQYDLTGDIQAVQWPDRSHRPSRQPQLWVQTCLECFLGQPLDPAYWEINLAPSEDWNIYALSRYRSALTEETAYRSLDIMTKQSPQHLRLSLILDLTPIVPFGQPLELSLTAVIQDQHDRCSYWAIAHTAPEPDFHDRDSFVVRL